MTAPELSQIIRSYQRNPNLAGVLSTGQRILLAIAMCDAALLPPGYETPLDAWRRLTPDEAAALQQGVLLSGAAA
ncbi:hypothetical protein [uncultured Ramlibacter sp.]|uniref:hypothetical protein n=1 Tax=uncultured Ramlibacter sp. TaxID=260755 RepID=UPI0026285207|nr:hypothetical protein [uncultured Ramlibacter sp.]